MKSSADSPGFPRAPPPPPSASLPIVISGADDTWSGRTNDVKRAAFGGKRKFLDQIGYAG